MIGAFSLVSVLYNTSIWATWKLVIFVISACFSISCWQYYFFSIECLILQASKRSACIDQVGLSIYLFIYLFILLSFPNVFPLKHYFHEVDLHFMQITFCGLLSVGLVFPFDPQIFCLLSFDFPRCFRLFSYFYSLLLFKEP